LLSTSFMSPVGDKVSPTGFLQVFNSLRISK